MHTMHEARLDLEVMKRFDVFNFATFEDSDLLYDIFSGAIDINTKKKKKVHLQSMNDNKFFKRFEHKFFHVQCSVELYHRCV